MADYTDKIDALLSLATELGFTEQDFAELAIAAADQAGADADQQHEIEIVLGLALDECANCGGSTAPGSPDPHECAPAPLTAETITDERIEALLAVCDVTRDPDDQSVVDDCYAALGRRRDRAARGRLAEILNTLSERS